MKPHSGMSKRLTLPLPAFVLHPLTALVIAAIHVYLASGHLAKLFGGAIQWTDIWKGFGAGIAWDCRTFGSAANGYSLTQRGTMIIRFAND
jgi:hypothetical protein